MRFYVAAITLGLVLLITPGALAANPPETINYQGVLRDSAGVPLSGGYRMLFRFYDSETAGSLLLTDAHDGSGSSTLVTVTQGLFNVWLGSGTLTPGEYSSLAPLFAGEAAVWLEVTVEDDPPMAPRTRILSSAYALSASSLAGHAASEFLETTTSSQTKLGPLTVDVNTGGIPNAIAVRGLGTEMGGFFQDMNNAGWAKVGYYNYGIQAQGNAAGGRFEGPYGVEATSQVAAGYFRDTNSSGVAYAGYGDYGVWGTGNAAGGYFNKVGIGITNPTEALSVAGKIQSTTGGFKFPDGTIQASAASGDAYSLDAADGSPVDVVYVNNDGQVSIGTTSSPAALEVVGIGHFMGGGQAFLGSSEGYGGFFKDNYDTSRTFITDNTGDGTSRPSGTWGIQAFAYEGGGYFEEWGTGPIATFARLASNEVGIDAGGNAAGGYFKDNDGTGYAWIGRGNRPIEAYGTIGSFFKDTDNTSETYIAQDNFGINAYGTEGGGTFEDKNQSGKCWAGTGDKGVHAKGNQAGGYFFDANSSGYAWVGYGDLGIEAQGNEAGGYFKDLDQSGYAFVGYGDTGIEARGSYAGGYFKDADDIGEAYLGRGGYALHGEGRGRFGTTPYSEAVLGDGNIGIQAYGKDYAAKFWDKDYTSSVTIASDNLAMEGEGADGARIQESDTGVWTYIAHDGYKVTSTGANSGFVQNHPYEQDKVIVYTAVEGNEVGTYTRGTARLVGGAAVVALDPTFAWVTNPDVGLTVQVTPRGAWADLYVESLSTRELVVRDKSGAGDVVFDYLVNGLRIGFEEVSIVQQKELEARIPALTFHREVYEAHPELRAFNALERFRLMREVVGDAEPIDLAASNALRSAIQVYDPAVHGPIGSTPLGDPEREQSAAATASQQVAPLGDARATAAPSTGAPSIPMDAEGNVYGKSFRPSASDVAGVMPAGEPLEPGDVVVFDEAIPGELRRGREAGDPAVAGCIVAEPGLLLGANRAEESSTAALATSGMVRCKADAGYGAIAVGDLLTVSATPGHAMRAADPQPGTILGKAVEPLAAGTGLIKVLVMLR